MEKTTEKTELSPNFEEVGLSEFLEPSTCHCSAVVVDFE